MISEDDMSAVPGDGKSDWYNFGLWSRQACDFPKAAKELAHKLALLGELQYCPHLLDIGPGYGAQLSLWRSSFQVEKITAIEPNPAAWERAKTYATPETVVLCNRLQDFTPDKPVHSVIAVDSCYHIPYNEFWDKIKNLSGLSQVVLSDFFLLKPPASFLDVTLLKLVGGSAKIPFKNFRTKDQYLDSVSFKAHTWQDVSEQVIDGFCCFVKDRFVRLTWSQRFIKSEMLKVYITYLMLKKMRLRGLIGYALILFKPDR